MTAARIVWTALLVSAALLSTSLTGVAGAQERPAPVAEISAGWAGFADDGIVSEGILGGAARFYMAEALLEIQLQRVVARIVPRFPSRNAAVVRIHAALLGVPHRRRARDVDRRIFLT